MAKRDWQTDWELFYNATAGPFEVTENGKGQYVIRRKTDFAGLRIEIATVKYFEDAQFISAVYEAFPCWLQRAKELEAENRKLRELISEVASATPSFDDERLGYVEIQVPKLWIKDALATLNGEEKGGVI